MVALIASATLDQVGMAGGALVSLSCSPNIWTSLSSLRVASSQADWTAGRSVASWYHLTWVAGSDRNCRNAHAASLFWLSLNTTMFEPPTNEVDESFLGIGATAHLPSMSAPPASLIRPMCHGPEKNIGWVPFTKAGVMSNPSGTDLGAMPSLKNES